MQKNIKTPLQRIIAPLLTPPLNNDTPDIEGMERLIEHTISGGIHGIFILGNTGEIASLSYKLRKKLIEQTCQLVNGRVPVLVGITDSVFSESLYLSKNTANYGTDTIVLAPPYYLQPASLNCWSTCNE